MNLKEENNYLQDLRREMGFWKSSDVCRFQHSLKLMRESTYRTDLHNVSNQIIAYLPEGFTELSYIHLLSERLHRRLDYGRNYYSGLEKSYNMFWGSDLDEKIEITKEEKSDYSITKDGIIQEQWTNITSIPSRLLEISDDKIILECLVDADKKIFENRKFDKHLLDGIIPFEVNYPVIIKIFKRPGEIKFKFIDGQNLIDLAQFKHDYFINISHTPKRF